MKYEVLKNGMAKDGRSLTKGAVLELDSEYAEHLINREIIKAVNGVSKNKSRAVSKPIDLEQAVEE